MSGQQARLPWELHPIDRALYAGLRELADLAGVPEYNKSDFYKDLSGTLYCFLALDLRRTVPPELNNKALLEAEEATRKALAAFARLTEEQERLIHVARHLGGGGRWRLPVMDDDTDEDPNESFFPFYPYLLEVTFAFSRLTGKPVPTLDKTKRMGAPKGGRKNTWLITQLFGFLFIICRDHGGDLPVNDQIPKVIQIMDSIFHLPAKPSLDHVATIKTQLSKGNLCLGIIPSTDHIKGGLGF
jgi:hypothetical protein